MTDSPVIETDIGDGETRRLYFGASEIRVFEAETGMGWRSFYLAMAGGNVRHDQIKRALRLALMGGGEVPKVAGELVEYVANPPKPLMPVWVAVSRCLEALWNGYEPTKSAKSGQKATDRDMDKILEIYQANFARNGFQVDLTGMPMAQVASLHDRIFSEDKPEAPDDEIFNAIKASAKKKG